MKSDRGFGLMGILFLILLTLKLTGCIGWSWWVITAPLWFGVFILLLFFLMILILYLLSRR